MEAFLVKAEVSCPQITDVRCPLFTGYRVQSSKMMRLWECGPLALLREVQGPQDRHFHSAVHPVMLTPPHPPTSVSRVAPTGRLSSFPAAGSFPL